MCGASRAKGATKAGANYHKAVPTPGGPDDHSADHFQKEFPAPVIPLPDNHDKRSTCNVTDWDRPVLNSDELKAADTNPVKFGPPQALIQKCLSGATRVPINGGAMLTCPMAIWKVVAAKLQQHAQRIHDATNQDGVARPLRFTNTDGRNTKM